MKKGETGAGQVGGRARFHAYSNVASGGWVNALKAYMEFGASGSSSGLASGLCAETVLSAGTSSGTYCALEGELVLGSGASTGTATSFIYLNASGAGVATFDTNGFLFEIGTGITPASGKFVSANSQTIKVKIEANTRYLVCSQTENGLEKRIYALQVPSDAAFAYRFFVIKDGMVVSSGIMDTLGATPE